MQSKETLALARVINDKAAKAARNEMEAGDYALDFTVRITGHLHIHEDGFYTPTTSLSVLKLAALAIIGRGATEEAFKNKMRRLMQIAVAQHTSTTIPWCLTKENAEALAAYDAALEGYIKEGIKEVKGELATLPKQSRKGAVKASLVVARVEPEISTGKLRKAKVSNPAQAELV
jgi:hypothetical protein